MPRYNEDEFDPKVPIAVETMSKSEFSRWLTEQDNQASNHVTSSTRS